MSRKALIFLLLSIVCAPGLVAQTTKTGRVTQGSLAARPSCPAQAAPGDEYSATDQVPVAKFICDTTLGWLQTGAYGPILPNTPVAFSATPSFLAEANASYSMTLTGNVTSSTTTGTPANGQLLSFSLCQDGVGSRTFTWPANFVATSIVFPSAANACIYTTWKFDGTNWQLVSNAGSGAGGSPAGPSGTIQSTNGTTFTASGETDNGTLFTARDSVFKGKTPWVDIRSFGARSFVFSIPNTTATTTAGSPNVTLANGSSFVNGDGVAIYGAGATNTLATPAAPTVVSAQAQYGTGMNQFVSDGGVGASTYCYSIVARTLDGQMTPGSPETCIANGQATLGAVSGTITSWSRSGQGVTITMSAPTTLVVGALVRITSADRSIQGNWDVFSVTSSTVFTIITSSDTSNGAAASGTGGNLVYYNINHISWANVTNAFQFYIYGRVTGGTKTRIGTSYPQNTGFAGFKTHNTWDDYGTSMGPVPAAPAYVPNTVPVAAQNGTLSTTIVSGGGTNNVVLANASNATGSPFTFQFDDAPAINAAIAATAGQFGGSVYIPVGSFPTYYPVNAFTGFFVNFTMAGQLDMHDTSYWNDGVIFNGSAFRNPIGGGSFDWTEQPQVRGTGAFPLVYIPVRSIGVWNVTFNESDANGMIMLQDGGGIPNSEFHHTYFHFGNGGGSDFMGLAYVLRGNAVNGGASNTLFQDCTFVASLPNGSTTDTPLLYFSIGGNPINMSNVMFGLRGIAFDTGSNGLQLIVDNIYNQGPVQPLINVYSSVANATGFGIQNRGVIIDSAVWPFVTYHGLGNTGGVFYNNDVATGAPIIVQGPGGVAQYNSASAAYTGNVAFETPPVATSTVDGFNTTDNVRVHQKFISAGVNVGPKYAVFVNSLPTAAPTCAVSAGGTLPQPQSYNFVVAPVFINRAEGTPSPWSNTCTTSSGNQTVTVNWTQVAGAIGYNIYMPNTNQSMQSSGQSPFIGGGNTTSFVWSGAPFFPIGENIGSTGGGPTEMWRTGLQTNAVFLPGLSNTTVNGYASLDAPVASQTNAIHLPDASGTVVLSPSGSTYLPNHIAGTNSSGQIIDYGVAPMNVYDSGVRANGTIQAGNPNWTAMAGTINISSNMFLGSGGNNVAIYNGASFPTDDQTVSATVAQFGATFSAGWIMVRGQPGAASGYLCGLTTPISGGNATYSISKGTAGGNPSVLTSGTFAAAVGDVFTCNVKGTTITFYKNSVQILQTTDATYTSGFPGLWIQSNDTIKFNNFRASFGGVSLNVAQTWAALQTFNSGLKVSAGSNALTAVSGNSGTVAQSTGALTSGNLASFDANGNVVNSTQSATGVVHSIFSGTATLGTSAIASGTCATVVTVSATGVATTDTIQATFNSDPSVITGYAPSASGSLYLSVYPTTNNINVNVCNNTGSSITPGAATLNVKVVR